MVLRLAIGWVVALCLTTVSTTALASDRTEPNSFLATRADTVQQLIDEVNSRPDVADRYERHFGKTKEDLIRYFGTLHLAKLNDSGTYFIYLVDSKGIIKGRPQRLKAGTRVFADSKGRPVLKAACGNALVPGSNEQNASILPSVTQASDSYRDTALTTPVSTELAQHVGVETAPGNPIALAPAMPDQVSTGNSNQSFAVPALLAAIGGAGAVMVGGSGHAPVPEPASLAVLVGALGAYGWRRRTRLRR